MNIRKFGITAWTRALRVSVCIALLSLAGSAVAASKGYTYSYVGNPEALRATPTPVSCTKWGCSPSIAMIGGGYDVGEAFRWMIARAGITKNTGGRFVIIRASGSDAYNPYVYSRLGEVDTTTDRNYETVGGADLGVSSVETLIIPSRAAAEDPFVLKVVARASAIFIAGGDQADYYNYWQGTALNRLVQRAVFAGIPVGGTSAGTAMLGQYAFAALVDGVTSSEALSDPYNKYMTIDPLNTWSNKFLQTGSFLYVPALAKTITDTHFNTRDRMGRLFAFVSRIGRACIGGIENPGEVVGMGIDEETALLISGGPGHARAELAVNPYNPENDTAEYTRQNSAYFVRASRPPSLCLPGKPLVDNSGFQVYRLSAQPSQPSPYPGAPQFSFKAQAAFNASDWWAQAVQVHGDGSSLSGPFYYGTGGGAVLGRLPR